MNYFAARYYDPILGRWHAPDPLEQCHSPYLAMLGDPANFIDPDGRAGIPFLQDFNDSFVGDLLECAVGASPGLAGVALELLGPIGGTIANIVSIANSFHAAASVVITMAEFSTKGAAKTYGADDVGTDVYCSASNELSESNLKAQNPNSANSTLQTGLVIGYSKGHGDEEWFNRIAIFLGEPNALSYSNGKEFVNKISDASLIKPIEPLFTMSHAGTDGLYMDDDNGLYRDLTGNLTPNEAHVADLVSNITNGKLKFADNAVWVLYGCNTYQENNDYSFAVQLALNLGVTVIAGNDQVNMELKNGKLTGMLKTEGDFYRIRRFYQIEVEKFDGSIEIFQHEKIEHFNSTILNSPNVCTFSVKPSVSIEKIGPKINPLTIK